ncbi:hypothetical protein ABTX15_17080 [Micromonospora sp. NPDC094482]|uniref:hypothetical protein n=1 Tax=unclassified Micromonospora TaxID=2617518 RepID=UPI0033270541
MTRHDEWVPPACTLPTAERPVRLSEFDDLFTFALREQRRLAPTRLRWWLDPAEGPTARDLADRESSCCAFFSFTVRPVEGAVQVDVAVPAAYVDVLDALAARALSRMPR